MARGERRSRLIALLLAGACGSPPFTAEPVDYTPPAELELEPEAWDVLLDDELELHELEAMHAAITAWTRAVSGACPIAMHTRIAHVDREALPPTERTITVRRGELERLGGWAEWNGTSSRILLGRGVALPVVTRHELGHGFAIEHEDVSVGGGIMRGAPRITLEDVEAFARRRCATRRP